jgi:putative RecB family exonuclease
MEFDAEAGEDSALEDSALEDNALEDNALEDNALEDNALEDNALEDNALEDNAQEDTAQEDTAQEMGDEADQASDQSADHATGEETAPRKPALTEVNPGVDRDAVVAAALDSGAGLPKYLSPSSAGMFQECPRRWKHRYIDRLPDPPGEPALAGTFAHRVLELLLQEPPEHRTPERAKELARDVWPEIGDDDDFKALSLTEEQARAFRWRSWQAIEGLWSIENPSEVVVEATEQDIRVEIGGVPFRGIVDRLDIETDGLVIADYKSGKAPTERYQDARLHQVLLYAAAVAELSGIQPARARLLYLNQRIIEVDVTENNIAEVTATLQDTWARLQEACQTGEFEAQTGPLCAWCPFVAHCPEGQSEVTKRHGAGRVRHDAPGLAIIAEAS